ncbi:unnamed protein product, partial [Coregonus sp. 'balchen']
MSCQDPFGNVIKGIMNAIHTHVELNPTCDLGTQNYEQWVVQKEQNDDNTFMFYWLLIRGTIKLFFNHFHTKCHDTLLYPKCTFLNNYLCFPTAAKQENQKVKVCAEHLRQYNEALYLGKTIRIKVKLQELAKLPQYEYNSLSKLRTKILQEFTFREKVRGIIFTMTHCSTIALAELVQENSKFEGAEQRDVLNKFRNAEVNLLIATTVAEEGLDMAACNFVIRYELVTNEITMIPARGRGRAENSNYTLVAGEDSGVSEREYREEMMSKATDKVKKLDQAENEKRKKQKGVKKKTRSKVKLSCRSCNKPVNMNPQFKYVLQQTAVLFSKYFLVTYDEKRINKWSELGIQLPAFDYAEHARSV